VIASPTTVAEAAELLRGHDGSVLIRGAGTKQSWGGRVDDPELVLDTTALRGVLTHNPADLTASVRAGTPLTELQDHLAGDGQWLALDPASAVRGATVGGLLATAESGPSRLRYGGIRDLVIGATIVLADGTVARTGGHVIKNVAGYDLAKLVHGSLGSLALIAEVVVRLHPRPVRSVFLTGRADAEQVAAVATALLASPLEPTALEWDSRDAHQGTLSVQVDGTAAAAAHAALRVSSLLAEHGVTATEVEAPDIGSTQPQAPVVDGETVFRVSGLPADLAALAGQARRAADEVGLPVAMTSSPALGLHTIRLGPGDTTAQAAAFTALRTAAAGASVLLLERPRAVDPLVDALGPPPSTAALLGRIKAQLDPDHRLGQGRFQPWF